MVAEVIPLPVSETGARLMPNAPRTWAEAWIRLCLLHDNHPTLIYLSGFGWHRWNPAGCWRREEDTAVHAEASRFLASSTVLRRPSDGGETERSFNPREKDVKELMLAARSLLHTEAPEQELAWLDPRASDIDPKWIVPIKGGWLDLSGERLWHHQPTPRLFTRYSASWRYEPLPTIVEWVKFLRSLWPDNPQQIALLQEVMGLLISGETKFQKILALDGPTRSGKSLIIQIVEQLVGESACASFSTHALAESFGVQAMIGKRIAYNSDVRADGFSDRAIIAERLLQISACDRLQVQRKNKTDFEGRLRARLLIGCNGIPRFKDDAAALPGRYIPVTLFESFKGREDNDLIYRLLPELPGIAEWAHAGLHRLLRRGHFDLPEDSVRALDALRNDSSPVRRFLDDQCEFDFNRTEDGCDPKDLFRSWVNWCAEMNTKAGTAAQFGEAIAKIDSRFRHKRRKGPRSERRPYFYTCLFLR